MFTQSLVPGIHSAFFKMALFFTKHNFDFHNVIESQKDRKLEIESKKKSKTRKTLV